MLTMDFSKREVLYVSERRSPASIRATPFTAMDMKLLKWYLALLRKDLYYHRRFTDIIPTTLKYLEYINGKLV